MGIHVLGFHELLVVSSLDFGCFVGNVHVYVQIHLCVETSKIKWNKERLDVQKKKKKKKKGVQNSILILFIKFILYNIGFLRINVNMGILSASGHFKNK